MADAGAPTSQKSTNAELAAALAATALATVTVVGSELAILRRELEARPENDFPGWGLAISVAGIAVIVVTAWMLRAKPTAAFGLAVAAAGALVPVWSGWSWMPDTMRVAVLAASPAVVAGVLRLASAARDSLVSSVGRVVDLLAGAAVVVHLVGYNAFADLHCTRTCADVPPLADSLLTTRSAIQISTVLTVGAAAVAAVLIVWRPTASRSVTAAALAAIGSVALAAIARWSAYDDVSAPSELLVFVPLTAAALVAATICVAGTLTWRTRIEVGRLVDRLAASPTSLRHVGAVGSIQFAIPDDARWVDGDGHVVVDASPANWLVINDGAGPAVRFELTGRRDATEVLAALTPATRLSLRNAQLAAVAKARVADVQASRRRVVLAADTERRRIERDLHDGAQQRLVSASFHLKAAIARSEPLAAESLARADATTRAALTRLRGIAHGIFPTLLATEGLGAALDDLVATATVPSTLYVTGKIDVGADTSMAAYATVAAALDSRRHRVDATTANVSVIRLDGTLTVTVDTEGANDDASGPSDLMDVADRVGAVGGALSVTSTASHTIITAVLPCES